VQNLEWAGIMESPARGVTLLTGGFNRRNRLILSVNCGF
jgi:hypothetical protein